jgi:hypothetical protein
MVKQPKKISIQEFHKINQNLKKESELCIGNYLLNGYRIQISKYLQSGSDRVMFIFNKRRALGQCIVCAKPVKRINRVTGKLYRLCDAHRATIDNYSP